MTIAGLLCCLPVAIPGLIGVWLLVHQHADRLSRMAGLFTLKPFLTTPIWFYSSFSPLGIIPGILITAGLVYRYNDLIVGPNRRRAAVVLLALDCLRWGNSLMMSLLTMSPVYDRPLSNVTGVMGIMGAALPFVYAIVAAISVSFSQPVDVYVYEKVKNDSFDYDDKPKRHRNDGTDGDALTLGELLDNLEVDEPGKRKGDD